jgi:hypothetical protein
LDIKPAGRSDTKTSSDRFNIGRQFLPTLLNGRFAPVVIFWGPECDQPKLGRLVAGPGKEALQLAPHAIPSQAPLFAHTSRYRGTGLQTPEKRICRAPAVFSTRIVVLHTMSTTACRPTFYDYKVHKFGMVAFALLLQVVTNSGVCIQCTL